LSVISTNSSRPMSMNLRMFILTDLKWQVLNVYYKSISYKFFMQYSCNYKVRVLDDWETV
jgi:hypothetical protein